MAREIAEQPAVLARILDEGKSAIRAVAAQIAARRPRFVLLAARGTSDHAALYAKYLFEILLGMPVGLASPSTMTTYGARPDLRDVLFIAVSQSGGSPDLVGSLTTAGECGALTVAVTNAPDSALAQAANLNIDVLAGPEKAVAATKSYTAQLLSLYLLVESLRDGAGPGGSIVDAAASVVANVEPVRLAAGHLMDAERLVVTGRGYAYPTAREAALKLMETSYVSAQPFSAADLLHGPMAMLQQGSAVIAVNPGSRSGAAIAPVIERLVELKTSLTIVGPDAEPLPNSTRLPLPLGLPEELSPIVEIIPLQMLARELSVRRGNDPDAPRGLRKVTETW